MQRRRILVLASAAATWPPALFAQAARKVLIGVLVPETPEPFLAAFREGMRAHGYVEGRDMRLELRSAQGKPDRLPGLAQELVGMKVDVLVAWQTPAAIAAKQATSVIPIAISAGDPVGTGLIDSLARPGGNITGVTGTTAVLIGKTLELLRELLPALKRVALLANATDPFAVPFVSETADAARASSIALRTLSVRSADEFEGAFSEFLKWRAEALIVQPSLPRHAAVASAMKYRLPAVSPIRGFAEAGGLMSYAGDNRRLSRDLAGYVDKILKGVKPGELPVQQPTTFELILNLKTAKALGISVPRGLLLRADQLIE